MCDSLLFFMCHGWVLELVILTCFRQLYMDPLNLAESFCYYDVCADSQTHGLSRSVQIMSFVSQQRYEMWVGFSTVIIYR